MKTPSLLMLAIAFGTLAGCVRVPTDGAGAAPLSAAPVAVVDAQAGGEWPAREWWQRYSDATLTQLIERALRDAPDIRGAQARFAEAEAKVRQAAANRGLRVDATADIARQRLSDNGLLPPRLLGFNWYSSSSLGLDARYGLDLWGKLAALSRAASADLQIAAAERDAVVLALASTVAEQYFGTQVDLARLALARQRFEAFERELQLTQARLRADISRADEAEQVNYLRLDALDRIGGLETSLALHRVALAALLGIPPSELPEWQASALPDAASELPPDMSLNLMSRRADLRAHQLRIASAAANLDAARAGFMPDISLRALLALSSRDLGELLDAGSAAPVFSAAVNLPLFDAGRLRAVHAREQARLAAAVAAYDTALIDAAREINVELTGRASLANQRRLRDMQVDSALRQRQYAEERLAQGLTDARPVIRADIEWLAANDARLVNRQAQLNSELALVRALGGGFTTGN